MTTNLTIYRKAYNVNDLENHSSKLTIKHNLSIELKTNKPEILFITSYPPRECGIATYSEDLIKTIKDQWQDNFTCAICALESGDEIYEYNEKPKFILNTKHHDAFVKTAFHINKDNNIKLVVIQHEFGFFASNEIDFKQFIENINKPIVLVFHTVLSKPDKVLKAKLKAMSNNVSTIVVMTKNAASILKNDYAIEHYKINIIPHGTHLTTPVDKEQLKDKYNLSDKKVLSTFGLLGDSKSIETTLNALPSIVKIHPDVMFLILGKTHPELKKKSW